MSLIYRRTPKPGDLVKVHFDFRPSKKVLVITDLEGEYKNKVVYKPKGPFSLQDAELRVQPAGPDKVRSGAKYVHAYAKGTVTGEHLSEGTPVRYDPNEMRTFETLAGLPVEACKHITLWVNDDGKPRTFAKELTPVPNETLHQLYQAA